MCLVSAGRGVSHAHREIMEDLLELVSQTVRLGCGAPQTNNCLLTSEINESSLAESYTFFPITTPFLIFLTSFQAEGLSTEDTQEHTSFLIIKSEEQGTMSGLIMAL